MAGWWVMLIFSLSRKRQVISRPYRVALAQ
jgi:hypothetical protein